MLWLRSPGTFALPLAAEVHVKFLGVKLREKCGVIHGFSHDILLDVDSLRQDTVCAGFLAVCID